MFEEFKMLLHKMNYPNIIVMSTDEIADIFHPRNRIKFLEWVLNELDISLPFTDNSENKKRILADILWQNGICFKSEKDKFLESSLDDRCQIKIFQRLFHYLEGIAENVEEIDFDVENIINTPLTHLANNEPLDIIPTKIVSEKIPKINVEALDIKAKCLEQKLKELQIEPNNSSLLDQCDGTDLKEFEQHLEEITMNSIYKADEEYKLPSDLREKLISANKNLLQYTEDIKQLKNDIKLDMKDFVIKDDPSITCLKEFLPESTEISDVLLQLKS